MVATLAAAATGFARPQAPAQANEWVVQNVMRWIPIVHQWHEEYPALDPAWVLAVIAQESMGENDVVGSDRVGSVGLMQIAPFAWRPSAGRLLNPSVNIRWGMGILNELHQRHPNNLRKALALYNCGEQNLAKGWCGKHGGYAYADVVIDHWLPVFREALQKVAYGIFPLTDWMEAYHPENSLRKWLDDIGYLRGLGKWKEEVSIIDALCYGYRFGFVCRK